MNSEYVLITPARNEDRHINMTMQSVANQTILPRKWVIVDDCRTDKTAAAVSEYSKKCDFIELINRREAEKRDFCSKVHAIKVGYEKLRGIPHSYIGNLDADVSFEPNYYESLIKKCQADPRLGITGGFIYEKRSEEFESRPFNRTYSVAGATQFFRRECFEAIGGYIPLRYGGEDSIAEAMARMRGWHVEAFPDLNVFHHKRTSEAQKGAFKAMFNDGVQDYFIGSSFMFEIAKCMCRIRAMHGLLDAVLRMSGYTWCCLRRERITLPDDVVRYLRAYHKERLRLIFNSPPFT